ncbi:cupin-like domain-containing protein [Pendulispora rubella]|uniref:Cupin-like domain-containing protein n=1 Tax=Pendulispora rubella TaxID=2741070 RepID=A0ABZ2L2Q6_9BACT
MKAFTSVPKETGLTAARFHAEYLRPERPVIIADACVGRAYDLWSPEYFCRIAPDLAVPIKEYGPSGIRQSKMTLKAYAAFLREHERAPRPRGQALPYCHDIPIFALLPRLVEDVQPFPAGLLSSYYQPAWWRYVQFFMGPAHSLTPLHFDTLLTHNLFFQVYGKKRFTIYAPDDAAYCGRRSWRWFTHDPEQPDYQSLPHSRQATPYEVVVGPGDILYLPPGTLHHVRGLGTSISFNIDFHTRRSALRSLLGPLRGMPRQSFYYNALATLGIVGRVPEEWVFRYYKPYLSYVV